MTDFNQGGNMLDEGICGEETDEQKCTSTYSGNQVLEKNVPAGYAEVEICHEGESLAGRMHRCSKKACHSEFIPVKDFSQDHLQKLPQFWNNHLVFSYIQILAKLTVRLKVGFVSPQRPDGYHFGDWRRGRKCLAYGSGWLIHEGKRFTEKDNLPCPCSECQNSSNPRRQWVEFRVKTAEHVVFDDEEAKQTTCHLFFDDVTMEKLCPQLMGTKIFYTDRDKDTCRLTCITHDLELSELIDSLCQQRQQLRKSMNKMYYHSKGHYREASVIVISHPHGAVKQISLGQVTEKEGRDPYKSTYTASTCCGSSGGLVWLLGDYWSKGTYRSVISHHSGTAGLGSNFCGDEGWYKFI